MDERRLPPGSRSHHGPDRDLPAALRLRRSARLWRPLCTHVASGDSGRRFIWAPEKGAEASDATFDMLEEPEFQASPIRFVFTQGERLRRRLCDPDCPIDFSFLEGFRNEGTTDFLAAPLFQSTGS